MGGFLQKMLVDAINMRASDLHLEPYENTYRVRFASTASCARSPAADRDLGDKLSSPRIKVISSLDIRRSACRRTAA